MLLIMSFKQRKGILIFGFTALTGVASYGCYLQGSKYFSSQKRWTKLNSYINNFNPVPYDSIDM